MYGLLDLSQDQGRLLVIIEKILLESLRSIFSFAKDREEDFIRAINEKSHKELEKSFRESKREICRANERITKLDTIMRKLYEDNLSGKVSDDLFKKLMNSYEEEQQTLQHKKEELEQTITAETDKALNTERFLKIIRRYTRIEELTGEIVREFVDKIYISKKEIVEGRQIRRIKIVWNFIGNLEM